MLADLQALERRARKLGRNLPIETVTPVTAARLFATALPVVTSGLRATAPPGRPDATSAPAAIGSIDRAVADVLAGPRGRGGHQSDRQERALHGGLHRSGPHRISGAAVVSETGETASPVMMLWAPELAVVPVTIHMPLKDVPQHAHHATSSSRPAASWRAICRRASASRVRGSRSPASTRMPARTARSARKI